MTRVPPSRLPPPPQAPPPSGPTIPAIEGPNRLHLLDRARALGDDPADFGVALRQADLGALHPKSAGATRSATDVITAYTRKVTTVKPMMSRKPTGRT